MAVFRVERTKNYTVMSNYHLKDKRLSLKAKGLLSQMLSLPDDWNYTIAGLCAINRESRDAIRSTIAELEHMGYLCVKDGEERGFTAAEFKQAQADGWEKQYQYKVGKKKVYMAPSAAQAQGYERVSKYPKSTKFGRQNPITERWNSDEQLVLWRAAWADVVNRHLERTGHEERIDHRSHAERGLLERPTIHEGVVARAMDAAYKTPWIAKKILEDGRIPIMPYTRYKGAKERYKPWEYEHDPVTDSFICPQGGVLRHTTTDKEGKRTYRTTPSKCKSCPCKFSRR